MFKKLSASSFQLSVWCLYQITNLSFFPGTFHFAQRLVFGRFLSAWKGVQFGQVKIWELGPNLLEDFFKWQLFSYDCFGGLWLPRKASVYPLWHFLWARWWHSEKPSSYNRNKLTRWMREFFKLPPAPRNLNGAFLLTVLTKYMYAQAWSVFILTSHRLQLVETLVFGIVFLQLYTAFGSQKNCKLWVSLIVLSHFPLSIGTLLWYERIQGRTEMW